MICNICEQRHGVKRAMGVGKALIPTWGNYRNNFESGATLYKVGSVLGSVMKCGECGHSVSLHGMLYKMLPQTTPGYVFTK